MVRPKLQVNHFSRPKPPAEPKATQCPEGPTLGEEQPLDPLVRPRAGDAAVEHPTDVEKE